CPAAGSGRSCPPGALAPGAAPPTGQALSTARGRLVGDPMREVFEQGAGPGELTLGSLLFGLLTTAFDGTVADLAATEEIAEQFAIPSAGRDPQAPMGTLISFGTHPG